MKTDIPTHKSTSSGDAQRLIARAASQGVTLNAADANALTSLGTFVSVRKLDGVCRLIRAAREEDLTVTFQGALQRIEICGGNVKEATRRILAIRREEIHNDISDTVQYAADRGVTLAPNSIAALFRKHGLSGTRDYIDKLGAIMDAASLLGVDCTQVLATRRLSLAGGDARRVTADFAAEHRRRLDRRTIACRVVVPPRVLNERPNAFAGCGCRRCRDRLAAHMQRYIGRVIAMPFFQGLDREEARAEANLELIEAVETWSGSNFTGWFATRFTRRVQAIYRSRSIRERATLAMSAQNVLSDDEGGRIVSLGERIPSRSADVPTIVLLRERFAEAALELRQIRADREAAYTNCFYASRESATSPRSTGFAKRPADPGTPLQGHAGSQRSATPSSTRRRSGHTVYFGRCSTSAPVVPRPDARQL